ncbi:MAG: hypothetical protein EA367_13480 [Leptolyngbya sp. DLM2.Bin15]|nr:MAG: hypothetical protein EA367_13480 [Leptolyngbya sp. DLM2.Bin15]
MVTFNRLLGLGLGAGLILFAVQNWDYAVPLMVLGRISPALPLSIWVLGAVGCGVATALILMRLFQSDAQRSTNRWTAPNEPAPRRSPPFSRWSREPRDRAGSPPAEPGTTKRDRPSRAAQRVSQAAWGETWDTPWHRSKEDWESWESWQGSVPKGDRREPLVTDAEVLRSTAEPSVSSRQPSYGEPPEGRNYGQPTYTYVNPDPELDQEVKESAVWDDWQTEDDEEPRAVYPEPGYDDLDDDILDLDDDAAYYDREADSLYDEPSQDGSPNVSVYDDPRFDDYDRDRAAAWQAWRDRHADDPDVDDPDLADSDAEDDLDNLDDWDDWDDDADQESDRPEEVTPSIYEVQRDPVRRQQSGTLYSYSYRNEEEVAPESPADQASESSDTVLQPDVTDPDAPRVLIPPYSSADDDDPPSQI